MNDTGISYASFWRRLLASVVDNILYVPFYYALLWGVSGVYPLVLYCFWLGLIGLYTVLCIRAPWQATIGQRVAKVYMTTANGNKPLLIRSTLRWFSTMLPLLPLIAPTIAALTLPDQVMAQWVNSMHFETLTQLMMAIYIAMSIVLALVVVWLLIWYIPIFFTRERKAIPDMLCGTRVVNGRML